MADAAATTVDPDSNNSGLYLIPVGILAGIAFILFVGRIWTRVTRTRKLYLDDWLILVAEPLSAINFVIGGCAVAYGWGTPLATLTPHEYTTTMKLQFALQTTWIFTLCFVRLSVSCSLLRFGTELWWKWTLYVIMALQILISSSYIVIQFGQCTPVSSNWENVPNVKCWNLHAIIDYGWAVAAIYVTMDLILSLMPIKLIRTLHRSTSEKILIGCLMALGLIATAVACGKMTTFNDFGKGDPMQATVKPSMYAKLEEVVGIIASCLPPLKAPIEQSLRRFGVLKEHSLTRPSFVNTIQLPTMNKDQEQDQRSSGEVSMPGGKDDIRVDSVSVMPGSANSNLHTANGPRKEAWDVV